MVALWFSLLAQHTGWLEMVTDAIIHEAGGASPGAEVVVDRLGEVLFIQIVRAYMMKSRPPKGFLAALHDRQISEALTLIHTQPAQPWTLELLARHIGMSRSAFAARFRNLVGVTPMGYVTRWRMQKAREMLQRSRLPLIEISEQVGYTSEAAFSRVFKRVFKQNPGVVRRAG